MLNDVLWAGFGPRLRRVSVALALPMVMGTHAPFPVNEVAIEGTVQMQHLNGRISTSVSTLVGPLPVHGRVAATHTCEGSFTGTVRYSALVRLAARVKRVHLVTALDGQVSRPDTTSCVVPAERVRGLFALTDTLLTGHVLAGDSVVTIVGIVRAVGDSAYHAELSIASGAGPPVVSLHLYHR